MDDIEIDNVNQGAIFINDDCLSEQQIIENDIEQSQDENIIYMDEVTEESSRRTKRGREEEEREWEEVKKKDKKLKMKDNKIEIYITCNESLPKLFALAKIFKSLGIADIERVKFITLCKVRVDLNSEVSAYKIETSQELIDKGWRISRAMETRMSFGVIKNVDMDMKDEEIVKCIKCPGDAELLSAYRLKCRDNEKNVWKACETVRLCFKGSFLPAYVMVDALRIRVEPYVFPVSQCAKCWKLGHTTKRCPSNKIVCPKCGGEHANCDTNKFKCINCNGSHMALSKSSCPAFTKEKKLRDIMAEFNCTYRRALTMYVSPLPPELELVKQNQHIPDNIKKPNEEPSQPYETTPIKNPQFAEVVKTKAVIHAEGKRPSRFTAKKQQQRSSSPYVWSQEYESNSSPNSTAQHPTDDTQEETRERTVHFWELLKRIKEILFMRSATIQAKVKMVIKCCVEWVVLLVSDFIPDWPILQSILEYLCSNG